MKDGGEKELGMGEERREEEKREDKILLSCRQTESPGVRWEWGRREGGVFLKQGSKLLRRSCVRVRVSLVCVCVCPHCTSPFYGLPQAIELLHWLQSFPVRQIHPGTQFS